MIPTRRAVLFLVFIAASLMASHSLAATPPEGFSIENEVKQAIKVQDRRSVKRRIHAAMMLREQGLLGEAYSSMVYLFPEASHSSRRASYLFVAGLMAYEISEFKDPNSYAWRHLIDEYGDDLEAKRAWNIIEAHYGNNDGLKGGQTSAPACVNTPSGKRGEC